MPQTDRPTAARAGAFTPAGLQYITQTHSILALVGAGLSVALLPQSVEHFCPADILLKTVEALDGINADLMLAWRSQSEIPPAAVLQVLKAEAVRHREAITPGKVGLTEPRTGRSAIPASGTTPTAPQGRSLRLSRRTGRRRGLGPSMR